MFLSHIVAMDQGRVIGAAGDLPWNIPDDMRFFMRKTKGHVVIMGRKTFESMPQPLPQRLNIVVTRDQSYRAPASVVVVADIQQAFARAAAGCAEWSDEVFVIGGGVIYRETLPYVARIYLTEVHAAFEGDTTYPELPRGAFREVSRERHDGPVAYSFVTLERQAQAMPIGIS